METASDKLEEGEDEVRYAWPTGLGYTCVTMVSTISSKTVKLSKSMKRYPSTDWALKLGPMKMESLVNADQHAALNTFSSLVHTARQITEADFARR
jgi:hypothetical protein